MRDTTVGNVQFGPGRDSKLTESSIRRGGLGEKPTTLPPPPPKGQTPPPEIRVPTGELRNGTCIGKITNDGLRDESGYYPDMDIRIEHLDPWARLALERGVEVLRKEGPL